MNVSLGLFLVALLLGSFEAAQAASAVSRNGLRLSNASDQGVAAAGISIRRIAVLGERHSGTNFMAVLLATNLDPSAYVYGNHFCQNRCGALMSCIMAQLILGIFDAF